MKEIISHNIYLTHHCLYISRVKHAIDTETNEAVAIKILDKEKIQKQNMGNQIKKVGRMLRIYMRGWLLICYGSIAF